MRRFTFLLICLLVLGITAVGFAAPKYGGIWKDALNSNPPYLDPVMATDTTSAEVDYQIFETLVENDTEGNLVPLLAESWEVNEDATIITFKLRKGVRFHATTEGGQPTANGGREVTAHDWVWTFNYICSPETNSPRAYFIDMIKGYDEYREGKTDHLAGVRALDDYTLQFELSGPFAPFLNVLAYNTFVVLPKEDVLKWGEDWNFHPVGTGPFKFEKWIQDDKIVLSKNENYWAKDENGNPLPYLDGIEFRIIIDHAVEWEEFKVGNIYQCYVDDPYYEEAKAKYPDTFFEKPMLGTYYYGMNMEKGPFANNKALRQAMNYAINREALIELVMNGRGEPAKGVLPPGMFAYNPDLKGYTYDPEKAKQLLKEAGYPDGFEVTLQYNTSSGHKRIAEALQAMYAQVGIKVNLKNVEWGTHLDTTARGEVPFFRMGWVADYNDPDNFLYVLLNSANKGPQGNYTRYHNPVFDMLTLRARRETNPEVRKKLYQEAEQIVVEDAPWVFIYHYTTHSLVQPFVKNYVLPSFGQYSNKFTKVWLDL
ncbi:peptide ABC transporter substrate-binding protein [Anoxybacter fermentans]|uniref:Peptide ABC transporter substrate-binding protein n=1 Tax=Anoxybacter fermentans TaxID=1323375 RepID=A0A3S9T2W9_9FIRM|nr:ABC transporter substrate-binding protein [Anoxybacter fermentans]AZR74896.1 peptide ABC transporter substrate-binding protein [Anoxybacter fermentans]